jgi:hypothetical protein
LQAQVVGLALPPFPTLSRRRYPWAKLRSSFISGNFGSENVGRERETEMYLALQQSSFVFRVFPIPQERSATRGLEI